MSRPTVGPMSHVKSLVSTTKSMSMASIPNYFQQGYTGRSFNPETFISEMYNHLQGDKCEWLALVTLREMQEYQLFASVQWFDKNKLWFFYEITNTICPTIDGEKAWSVTVTTKNIPDPNNPNIRSFGQPVYRFVSEPIAWSYIAAMRQSEGELLAQLKRSRFARQKRAEYPRPDNLFVGPSEHEIYTTDHINTSPQARKVYLENYQNVMLSEILVGRVLSKLFGPNACTPGECICDPGVDCMWNMRQK